MQNGLGPQYISDLLLHDDPSRPLRPSGTSLLSVPRVRTKHAANIQSNLPENCCNSQVFLIQLMTFLFAFYKIVCTVTFTLILVFLIFVLFHFIYFMLYFKLNFHLNAYLYCPMLHLHCVLMPSVTVLLDTLPPASDHVRHN